MHTLRTRKIAGFTLIELLVVIGIIALLIAIILPSLRKAKLQAQSVACKSNLQNLFRYMLDYANYNKGYMFPVRGDNAATGNPETLGTNYPPHLRWPAVLFGLRVKDPVPAWYTGNEPADIAAYRSAQSGIGASPDAVLAFMATYDATPFTPPVLRCPNDIDPYDAHSYVVNHHLVQQENPVRYANGDTAGRPRSDIIVAGEKRTQVRDYHMERGAYGTATPDPITGRTYASDFDRVVEPFRHGLSYGSNYLFLDGHVDTKLPATALDSIDPWAVAAPTPQTPTVD
ncbi:MAG TPA: prepilin-type N-terminal cleavage/methylation domain-containing protein [Tepidisphaeraceae bacterium]|jgi:prepilin-type N-terminal cleavage/methylation domain-containing protein/prepilin-type processing-associated H-X9-DG protein